MRASIELARAHLMNLEESADRLAAVRETAVALAAKTSATAGMASGSHESEPHGANSYLDQAPTALGRPSMGPLSDKIISVIASSGRAWRARKVTEAIGEKDASRDRVHSIRNTLSRLVEMGYLERAGAGLYGTPAHRTETL